MLPDIMQPEVSIIIPSYNQVQYLPEALQSIQTQTFSNWECIVVSDGSPDNVRDVVTEYVNADTRITFYDTENGGVSAARNFAISKARGAFILPLDADDKISENYVEECLKVIKANKDVVVVYGAGEKFGEVNEKIKRADYNWNELLLGNMIHVTGMYRRKDWETIKGYDEQMKTGMEDWEFWINLLKPGRKAIQINTVDFYQRVNNVSRTTRLHDSGAEKKINQYVYCKHAALYEHLFIDPLTVFKERNYYHALWNWAKKNPLKLLFSKNVKKI